MADTVATIGAARTLRQRLPLAPDAAFDLAQEFEFGGIEIAPIQRRSEIVRFLQLAAAEPPRTVLEIGTAEGGTLLLLSQAAGDDATVVAVDARDDTRSLRSYVRYRRRRHLFESFARRGQRLVYLPLDSHSPATVERVRQVFERRPVDLLFIDGDHSAAGVAADYEMYSPLVRPGGFIGFHDIVPGRPEAVGGVPEFWQRIKTDDAVEFVEGWDQGGAGIGVLQV